MARIVNYVKYLEGHDAQIAALQADLAALRADFSRCYEPLWHKVYRLLIWAWTKL